MGSNQNTFQERKGTPSTKIASRNTQEVRWSLFLVFIYLIAIEKNTIPLFCSLTDLLTKSNQMDYSRTYPKPAEEDTVARNRVEKLLFGHSAEKHYPKVDVLIAHREDLNFPSHLQRDNHFGAEVEMPSPDHKAQGRTAFKSPFSARYPSTMASSHLKEVQSKLDFSVLSSKRESTPTVEKMNSSANKCSVDKNYISRSFTLKKLNYSDMKQEVERLNTVQLLAKLD